MQTNYWRKLLSLFGAASLLAVSTIQSAFADVADGAKKQAQAMDSGELMHAFLFFLVVALIVAVSRIKGQQKHS
ncbi:hypothetical protein [Agaribacterium haliotis]|uniref:hypothetical protein n=1 Tax=Agaribacterium haliotis TaxID=2013869 RepID=UPI000BB532F6|nr:hypothetical protein [Agaribacterium haliotis]